MKSYLIDEVKPEDVIKLKRYLKEKGFKSPIENIFWVELPTSILSRKQKKHLSSCGPYVFSIETGKDWIKLEFLIRPTSVFKCSCISYPNKKQRSYAMDLLDSILKELNISY